MKAENQKERMVEDDGQNSQPIDASRRLFSKRGVAASVIMTLANRSAWGANVCVGTGFQSFAAAGGVMPSHAHANLAEAGTANWLSPNKWYTGLTSWQPNGFLPVRSGSPLPSGQTSRIYEMYINGAWTKKSTNQKYNLTEVQTYLTNNSLKGFVNQLPGFSSATNTIYDALNNVLGQNQAVTLEVYQIVTAMNNLLYPLPIPPKGKNGAFDLADYQLFYAKCVNP